MGTDDEHAYAQINIVTQLSEDMVCTYGNQIIYYIYIYVLLILHFEELHWLHNNDYIKHI